MKKRNKKLEVAKQLEETIAKAPKYSNGDVAAICDICNAVIPEKQEMDSYCHGCKAFICDKHTNASLMGAHGPDDHDLPEDDED